MIYNTEKRQEHQEAIALTNKYKECNANTKVKLAYHCPKAKIWYFETVKRDERHAEMKSEIKPARKSKSTAKS